MRTKRFTTKQERLDSVVRFLKSQQTQVAWCAENNVPLATFSRWMQEYKKAQEDVKFVSLESKSTHVHSHSAKEMSIKASTTVLIEIGVCKIHMPVHEVAPLIMQLLKKGHESDV